MAGRGGQQGGGHGGVGSGSSRASVVLSSDISRRNPQDEYELLQRIGSGTYGDVYKVSLQMIENNVLSSSILIKLLKQNIDMH